MGRILVGISAWSEPELVKSGFYPSEVQTPTERLRYYSSIFPVTEIDASYHFFPTRRDLELWLGSTPDNFTFTVKAFGLFTGQPTLFTALPRTIREKYIEQIQNKRSIYQHHLPDEAIDELWTIFRSTLETFKNAGKLGAVLFQFPPWFYPNLQHFYYILDCKEKLPGYNMAVEFRMGGWLGEHKNETLKFLREHKISLVCVDEPQGFKSSNPPVAEATAELGIIRFHGRNKENWERKDVHTTQKYSYLYSADELKDWVPKIEAIQKQTKELHIIFKNKHLDYPVRNALQMKELLGIS